LGDDFFVVRTIEETLETIGYVTQVRLADAPDFAVPQHRKRLIILARSDGGTFTWPPKSAHTCLRDTIGDLPPLGDTTGGGELPYRPESVTTSDIATFLREGAVETVIHDHMTRPVRPDDRVIFAGMTSKTLYSDVPLELRRYRADQFDDKYKKLDWNEPS